jgi:catechol 2,3-dioxygenase-like lactoylglutathione lyase family enzyme
MAFVDHLSVGVSDVERAGRFYDALLAPLGARRLFEERDVIAYGTTPREGLFVINPPSDPDRPLTPQNGGHVCFSAASRAAVEAFHAAGLAAGGRDNGAPGYRPQYAPDYYGAFIIDPDGNHVGVVARVAADV